MFFNKKKKQKLDPKVRFQNRQFNQKLNQARNFKRAARPVPETGFDRFLQRVGLASRWMQIFVALLVLGVVYVIYAPNFLTLQDIRIEGLSDEQKVQVENAIQDNINQTPFYNPQRNLFFLSKNRVKEIVNKLPGIAAVENLDKDFKTKTLIVTVKSKQEKFLVRTKDGVFDVFSDGLLKGLAGVNYDSWLGLQNPGMIKLEIEAKISNLSTDSKQQQRFLSETTVEYMAKLNESIKGITGSSLAYFSARIPELQEQQEFVEEALPNQIDEPVSTEDSPDASMPETEIDQPIAEEESEQNLESQPAPNNIELTLPINADELNIVMQKGTNSKRTFNVFVDTKENPDDLVQRLNLLLSQTAPDRYNNLFYIDMRIPSRAFVCLTSSPCIR